MRISDWSSDVCSSDLDTAAVSAHVSDRTIVRLPPPVDLREMLLALRDVLRRADLFSHHAIKREALSVRQRMGELLSRLVSGQFHDFTSLFTPEEGDRKSTRLNYSH